MTAFIAATLPVTAEYYVNGMDTYLFPLLVAALAFVLGVLLSRRQTPAPATRPDDELPLLAQVTQMGNELRSLQALVTQAERERAESFGMIGAQIRATGEQTARLADTTGALREALAGHKTRGQWGERMAEDVLRLAGFVEDVNYVKQSALSSGGVPDFTFLLPGGMRLHMDVKFPLDNYLRALHAEHEHESEAARAQFLRDVRTCIKGLAERRYAEAGDAVDCVLLFVPNEQLFAWMQAQDPQLLDEALGRKIVCCSPMTLFAVLAVVRQAVDNFSLARTSDEILIGLSRFSNEWRKFSDTLDKVSKQLDTVRRSYDELTGPRRRQLERPLQQLDDLRQQRGLSLSADDDDYTLSAPSADASSSDDSFAS